MANNLKSLSFMKVVYCEMSCQSATLHCEVKPTTSKFVSPRVLLSRSPRKVTKGRLTAVVIVAGNDVRTAGFIFVGGAISGIVAAPDACTRSGRFNEFDVVFVTKAGTPLWVTLASSSTA